MSEALNDLMKLKYPDKEWKTFTHAPIPDNMIPEVYTETINRKRFYVTPDGNKYPSITTVSIVAEQKKAFKSGVNESVKMLQIK